MNGFSANIPGRWSSHPEALRMQRVWMFLGGSVSLFLVVFLCVHLCIEPDLWRDLTRHAFHGSLQCKCLWLKLGAILSAVAFGFFATVGLLHALSLAYKSDDKDTLPIPGWLVFLTGVLWLAPIAFSLLRRLFFPSSDFALLGWGLNVLCFVPVLAVLVWIKRAGRGARPRPARTRWALPVAIGLTVLALPGFAVQSTWGVMALTLASTFWTILLSAPEGVAARKDEEAVDDDGKEPAWVQRLVERLPDGISMESEIAKTSIPVVSTLDAQADAELLLLMDGKTPTLDQSQFFRKFRDGYEDALRNRSLAGGFGSRGVGHDLLVAGVEGAGRTEIFLAAALYASIVRGHGALYVVESQQQAEALAEKVNRRIASLMLGEFVRAESLSRITMDGMMDPQSSQGLPCVLFSTPESIEQYFFADVASSEVQRLARMREIIREYNTVFVDDFSEYPLVKRIHTAFLIDKWRLVLVNELVVPQFVVGVCPLYLPDGAQELGRRLFGTDAFSMDRNLVSLRPRASEAYWSGTLVVDPGKDVGVAIRELINICLTEELKVLYYARGISSHEKVSIVDDLEARTAPLTVVGSMDEITDADADAVLHLSLTSENAAAALRLRAGGAQSVYLRIVSGASPQQERGEGRILPLPDESAVSLRVYHLASVLPYVPEKSPVNATVWSRFGITLTGRGVRNGAPSQTESVPAQWMYDEWTEGRDGFKVAPYWVLERRSAVGAKGWNAWSDVLPELAEVLWRTRRQGSVENLLLARPTDSAPVGRSLVEWRDEWGNVLGETDLAHVERFECRTEANTYVLDHMEGVSSAAGRRAAIAVGQYARGAQYDYVVLERSVSWGFDQEDPPSFNGLKRMGNVATVTFDTVAPKEILSRGRITGLVTALGQLMSFPVVEYACPVYASCLILNPAFSPSDDKDVIEARMRALLEPEMSTASGLYSPALTHAFAAALKTMLDGAGFYAFTCAFHCRDDEFRAGDAVIWFIEPKNSGRSLHPLFSRLLGNPRFAGEFFRHARESCARFTTVELMRAASGMAIKGDAVTEEDQARAAEVLAGI